MKITRSRLKQIIAEELEYSMNEDEAGDIILDPGIHGAMEDRIRELEWQKEQERKAKEIERAFGGGELTPEEESTWDDLQRAEDLEKMYAGGRQPSWLEKMGWWEAGEDLPFGLEENKMKIHKSELEQIIREELDSILMEQENNNILDEVGFGASEEEPPKHKSQEEIAGGSQGVFWPQYNAGYLPPVGWLGHSEEGGEIHYHSPDWKNWPAATKGEGRPKAPPIKSVTRGKIVDYAKPKQQTVADEFGGLGVQYAQEREEEQRRKDTDLIKRRAAARRRAESGDYMSGQGGYMDTAASDETTAASKDLEASAGPPEPKGPTRGQARARARRRGELSYTWNGKKYGTRGSAETPAQWKKKMAARRARSGRGPKAGTLPAGAGGGGGSKAGTLPAGAGAPVKQDDMTIPTPAEMRRLQDKARSERADDEAERDLDVLGDPRDAARDIEARARRQRQELSDLLGGPTQLQENDTGRLTLNEMNEMRRIAGLPLLKND